MFGNIIEPNAGENILEWAKRITELANREITGEDFYTDKLGTVIMGGGTDTDTAPRHFELKDAHTPGTTSTAYLQNWSGTAWVTDTDTEFEVTDPLSKYRGRGKDDFSSPHDTGSLGVAEQNSASGEWEIVKMQPNALAIEGAITADDTLTADGCHVMAPSGGIIVDQDPAGNITFTNPHGHPDIDNNMLVFLVWDESIAGWTERQKDCP